MTRALLFDLDETLMVEEPAAAASFAATAQLAATRYGAIDPAGLAAAARSRARELWYTAPTHDYCMRTGISSWEGLWCRFAGEGPAEKSLHAWSPTYRREAWRLALVDQGVDDACLAEKLAERFGVERRARHEVFGDAVGALELLKGSHAMAVVTNGAACLQREKLAVSGLGDYFETVVVSADLGIAKPDAAVFEYALSQLGVTSDQAVMVGDSIAKDIDGALRAGLEAVWVNRNMSSPPPNRLDLAEIATLSELPALIDEAS